MSCEVDLLSSCEVKSEEEKTSLAIRAERTLGKSASLRGIGLFSGQPVSMTFIPASSGTGIVFKRVDLPGKPQVRAHIDNIFSTPRCTILNENGVIVQSVEHLLSALKAFEVDNLIIELSSPEIPVGDGSSLSFVELIENADVVSQDALVESYYVKTPVYWAEGNVLIVALPSKEMRFSYTLSYPGHPLLHSQFYTFVMDERRYVEEIAPCRTFCLYEEILPLLEKGLIKGGTLENGVIIKGKEVLNQGGSRFPDEMVRHKILDLIGDISLAPFPVVAHFVAIRSGHHSNTQMAKMIVECAEKERKQ